MKRYWVWACQMFFLIVVIVIVSPVYADLRFDPEQYFDEDEYSAMLQRYIRKSENFQFYCEHVCDASDDEQFEKATALYLELVKDADRIHKYRRGEYDKRASP